MSNANLFFKTLFNVKDFKYCMGHWCNKALK